MIDFSIKNLGTDSVVDLNELDVTDELDLYLNQIKMVFFTSSVVMGAPDLSINLEDLVYSYRLKESELQNKIIEKINKYCSFSVDFPTSVQVKFFKGEIRDIVLIDINIGGIKEINIVLR
jgi:hypothetical protein